MTSKKRGTIEISYPLLGSVDEVKDAQIERIMGKTCDCSGASVTGELLRHLTWDNRVRTTMAKAKAKAKKLGLKNIQFTFWPNKTPQT